MHRFGHCMENMNGRLLAAMSLRKCSCSGCACRKAAIVGRIQVTHAVPEVMHFMRSFDKLLSSSARGLSSTMAESCRGWQHGVEGPHQVHCFGHCMRNMNGRQLAAMPLRKCSCSGCACREAAIVELQAFPDSNSLVSQDLVKCINVPSAIMHWALQCRDVRNGTILRHACKSQQMQR